MSASDHWHKSLSFVRLGRRLLSMPLVVVLIPFVVGIALADVVVLPMGYVAALGALLLVGVWLLRRHSVVWLYGVAALIVVGYMVAELRQVRGVVPLECELPMTIVLDSEPRQRDGYQLADGRIVACGEVEEVDERVLLWIRDYELSVGDVVYGVMSLNGRLSRGEEYDRLLRRRGYVGGVGLNGYNIDSVKHSSATDLQSRAIAKLRRAGSGSAVYATVEAMVTGSRRLFSADLRDAYSRTGLSHLMAVSGLHLGIVAMVVGWLLAPLRLLHRGHRLAGLLTIILLWVYATMSGLSPSVVRAALMFSVLLLSTLGSLRYDTLNALAAAILLMLVYRPNYLYDISFQLSVTAVVGIVVWGVPLLRRVRIGGVVGWLLSSLVVGVAATLWTLPIISHSFGNIPLIGVIATPFAIVTTSLIVALGIVALLLPDIVARPVVAVAEWCAEVQNGAVEWLAQMSWSSFGYTLSERGVWLYYALFVVITIVIWSINRKKVVTLSEYDDYRRHRDSQK